MACQRPEERREKILEPVALPEHVGGVEAGAGGIGFERLDEAVDVASFKKLLDRPRATFSLGSAARPLFPEAQRRHVDAVPFSAMIEADGLDPAVVGRKGYDGIAGPEVDADRDGGRGVRHEPLCKMIGRGRTISGFAPACQDPVRRGGAGPRPCHQTTRAAMCHMADADSNKHLSFRQGGYKRAPDDAGAQSLLEIKKLDQYLATTGPPKR